MRINPEAKAAAFYLSEVLGIRRYLRPPELTALRLVRGPLPCRMLAVAAGGFSHSPPESSAESQRALLKKIMRAVGFEDFSVLELKRREDLPAFFGRLRPGSPADFVCAFGGRLAGGMAEGLKARSSFCFHTSFSLGDLDGGSSEAADRKRQLWAALQAWQNKWEQRQ